MDTLAPNRPGVGLASLLSCGLCPPQFDTPEKENVPEGQSPIILRQGSLTSSMSEEEDDGFVEILHEEEMKVGRVPPSAESMGSTPAWGGGKQLVGLVTFTFSSASPLWPSRLLPWQTDADVPQGMENLLTAPLVRKEEAELVCVSLEGWRGLEVGVWGQG